MWAQSITLRWALLKSYMAIVAVYQKKNINVAPKCSENTIKVGKSGVINLGVVYLR